LKNKKLNAPRENKENIDVVINLYASGKIPNYLTAENLVDRLANKTKRADYIARTEKDFAKIVGKYQDAESVKGMLERGREKRKLRDVTITMMLFREKDGETNEDTTVNVDFPAGTTVASALAQKKEMRKAGKKSQKIRRTRTILLWGF